MTKLLILLLTVTVLFPELTLAGNSTSALPVLKIAPGARPTSMGEAFTAVSDDANAVWFNPAGISQIKSKQAMFTHIVWFQEISYDYFAGIYPLNPSGTLGVHLGLTNSGEFNKTNFIDGNIIETGESIKASDLFVGIVYAHKLNDKGLSFGVGTKYITSQLANLSGMGLGIDTGILLPVSDKINLGAAVQNVGLGTIKYDATGDPLPMTIRAGAKLKLNKNLTTAVDYVLPSDHSAYINPGVELVLLSGNTTSSLRAGYKIGSPDLTDSGLSAGAGFLLQMTKMSLGVDIAYVSYGTELGNVIRASVLLMR